MARQWLIDTTICAIASGTSPAPRGIIRVSGPHAVEICQRLVADVATTAWSALKSMCYEHRIAVETLRQPLECKFFVWPTIRSYTGQPSVEIHTIGNALILQLVVEQLCGAGAVVAQPGEFTYRAFMNGRLDLTQCEAVLGVIHAASESALQISLKQLAGGLSQPLNAMRRMLVDLLADLEAGLDFVDEDIEFISRAEVQRRITEASVTLSAISQQLGQRRHVVHRPKVVLIGMPNVGKSSLINALVGHDVAIVSDQAGTTRDFIRVPGDFHGVSVELIDTAGFETVDRTETNSMLASVRTAAQSMMRDRVNEADLVLFCVDTEVGMAIALNRLAIVLEAIPATRRPPIWLVQTKADKSSCVVEPGRESPDLSERFRLSSLRGDGVAELRMALGTWALEATGAELDVTPMTLVRCSQSIEAAREALANALECCVSAWSGDEIIAAELRACLQVLGQVVGEVYTDDILDALFSRFCIGK